MPSNTTRIAQNTFALYFRQILIVLVNLYTMRLVLEALGVEDYGTYNVAGGIIVLFSFLDGAMSNTTQRFLNFALGRNDAEQAGNVYSASVLVHAFIVVLVVILAQTVGLWFFYTWLNIPLERQDAAFVVYQLSVFATVIGILQVPYRATIIAYEKMSFFAMLGIVEAALRLGIVFLLPIILFDQLIVYAFLVCITRVVIFLIHKVYCNKMFEIARFQLCRDKKLFRHLLKFSGWNTFGGMTHIGKIHGTNILINIFHGVTVNAAMGIATQIHSAIHQFVSNFQVAFSPQIIKSYSAKEYDYFLRLILRTSKMSFYLLFFFVLPLYINAEFVLQIWLNNVPRYTVVFTRLLMLSSLITVIPSPIWRAIDATGDIKRYKLIGSCFVAANLPLSLLLLWTGFSPVWVLIIRIILDTSILVVTIFFMGRKIKLPVFGFFREVIIPICIIVGGAVFITVFVHSFLPNDWKRLVVSCIVSTISIGCLAYLVGLNREEKKILQNWIRVKTGRDK